MSRGRAAAFRNCRWPCLATGEGTQTKTPRFLPNVTKSQTRPAPSAQPGLARPWRACRFMNAASETSKSRRRSFDQATRNSVSLYKAQSAKGAHQPSLARLPVSDNNEIIYMPVSGRGSCFAHVAAPSSIVLPPASGRPEPARALPRGKPLQQNFKSKTRKQSWAAYGHRCFCAGAVFASHGNQLQQQQPQHFHNLVRPRVWPF